MRSGRAEDQGSGHKKQGPAASQRKKNLKKIKKTPRREEVSKELGKKQRGENGAG